MQVQASIDKHPSFVASKDYEFLRNKGIAYLRQLASEVWTDHNIHDPGITLTEMICYAITELGYKADYIIEDILAETTLIDEINKLSKSDGSGNNDTYFSPREILPCNPLTIEDWRKLIIDVPLVRNAWLIPLEETSPAIYCDAKKSVLSFSPSNRTKRLNLDGLFEVKLEFEDDETLGDLNLWKYKVPLASDESKLITLYFHPTWEVFFENKLDAYSFDHTYWSPLDSIDDTSLYSGVLYFKSSELVDSMAANIESPLPKTDTNKNQVEASVAAASDEIGFFLKERISKCSNTTEVLQTRVHRHRNLCEDFVSFRHSEVEEIGVCTDIEVRADADVELVLANIIFAFTKFFSPDIPFYSLEELQQQGHTLESIFSGPALQHGFIKDDDLLAADYRTMIHVSDLLQILMDIDGVVAVKDIQLNKHFGGLNLNDGEKWCLPVTENRSLKFNLEKSKIVFYKGLIPYRASELEALERVEDLRALEFRYRLPEKKYDIDLPDGKDQNLRDYHSVQNDFPLVYGVGPEGLAPSSTDLRKAQAKQLKAFLMLIDQIFANYCAQLSNLKNLFSLDRDIRRTYFSQPLFSLPATYKLSEATLDGLRDAGWAESDINELQPLLGQAAMDKESFSDRLLELLKQRLYLEHKSQLLELCEIPEIRVNDLPNVASLVEEFVSTYKDEAACNSNDSEEKIDWDRPSTYDCHWNDYLLDFKARYLEQLCERDELLESARTYEDRRNRFLDHLLARFGENFGDYVLLNAHTSHAKGGEELIEDKIDFLKDYPLLSRDRGKAFDYRLFGVDTNVSGLERKVGRLVGIDNWQRTRLFPDYLSIFERTSKTNANGDTEWHFRLRGSDGEILFSSTDQYFDEGGVEKAMEAALYSGIHRQQYDIEQATNGKYHFVLRDEEGDIIARRRKYYDSESDVERLIQAAIELLKYHDSQLEGFHLVEHILLRPISSASDLFRISSDVDCSPGYRDPYSFRATAVVPYRPDRFQDIDFRRYFEETLRKEAPAHIHIKICWIDGEAMKEFEECFFPWLKLKTTTVYTQQDLLSKNDELIEMQNKLLHILENFNSVYPETHLYDCSSESDTRPLLLDHSKLGSKKGN